jgi:hypothetical protein
MSAIESLEQLIDHAMQVQAQGDVAGAICILDKVIEVYPDHRMARTQRGRLRLKTGDFAAGATDFEYFYRGQLPSQKGIFANPDGSLKRLDGQHIIIASDAGLGDLVQFVRYGVLMKSLGAKVTVECGPAFHALCRNSVWIDQSLPQQDLGFDFASLGFAHRVPLHNLFAAFGTTLDTIPAYPSYLRASSKKIRLRRDGAIDGKARIGISWRSANESASVWKQGRSIDLPLLAEAFDPTRQQLVCLQKEISVDEQAFIRRHGGIVLPAPPLEDLDDTAAVMATLDLVVSTCTVTPHLSGALGIPTLLLLSRNACWRWMTEGTGSPWYPSLTLLRQDQFGDWTPVLESLRRLLACVN